MGSPNARIAARSRCNRGCRPPATGECPFPTSGVGFEALRSREKVLDGSRRLDLDSPEIQVFSDNLWNVSGGNPVPMLHRRSCVASVAVVALCLMICATLHGQEGLSTIRGTAKDATGGVSPGVTVTAREVLTNIVA